MSTQEKKHRLNEVEINDVDLYTWEDLKRVFWLGATAGLVSSVFVILIIWWII